jgi:PAS domain S-box-containing protein
MLSPFRNEHHSWLWRSGVAAATTGCAVVLTHLLWPFVQYTPFLLGFAAAILAAAMAGRAAGFLAVGFGLIGYVVFPPPLQARGFAQLLAGFALISGTFSWLVGTHREIEAALRASQRRLTQAQELAHVGNWQWDVAQNALWWSDELYRIFGVDRASFHLTYSTFLALVHPDDRATIERAMHQAAHEHEPYDVTHRIVRPDGEVRVLNGHGRAEVDETGQDVRVIGAVQDITELRAAEETVRRSERRLQTIIDAEPACVKLVSPDGLLLDMNRAGLHMVGATDVSEVVGRPAVDLVHPQDGAAYLEMHRQVCNGSPSSLEFRIVGLRGRERWVDAHVVPFETLTDSGDVQATILSVASEVTERKRLEDRLRQSLKMEAVGRLAAGIAHDFNNLLVAISGYSEMVSTTLEDSDTRRADLMEVRKAAERAAALTRQLLAFGRQQLLRPRVLDVNLLIGSVQKLLRRTIRADIDLTLNLNPFIEPIRVDPSQLEHVLLNLAVNAQDAMPNGGRLSFTTENVDVDRAFAARLVPMTPGPYVRVTVSDTGTGIAAEIQARVFEPFFTTKGGSKGTGLGLATAYGVVKQSGGFIWLTSHPGQGTTFDIYLPAVAEAVETQVEPEHVGQPTGGSETILLAEDDTAVRQLAAKVLRQWGYTVLEARDGDEALGVARSQRERIDLLVTDVVMPGLGGRALAVKVSEDNPSLRVLYASGYTADQLVQRDGRARVSFLAKPFLPLDLVRKVREVLDSPDRCVDEVE